jgi:hypothetical protein
MLERRPHTDIRDLLLDPDTFLSPRQLLNRHRQVFFDPASRLWRECSGVESAFFWTRDQLLAVWATAHVQPKEARDAYADATCSGLYDEGDDLWRENAISGDEEFRGDPGMQAQLVATLCELAVDETRGRARFERLQRTNRAIGGDQFGRRLDPELSTTDYLLAALIHVELDRSIGNDLFETLQRSELYDPERQEWRNRRSDWRTSYAQLLGVFIEWLLDAPRGRKRYERLLRSGLYDARLNEWCHAWHRDEGIAKRPYTAPHLVDVAIRARFDYAGPATEEFRVPERPTW